MSSLESTFGAGGDSRALSALLFIGASTNAMDVYSALNSSPWTAESFGADPEKRKACLEYVHHSLVVTGFYAIAGTLLAENAWPLIGWAIASSYMYWLYARALRRAQERGSTDWDGGKAPAPATADSVTARAVNPSAVWYSQAA